MKNKLYFISFFILFSCSRGNDLTKSVRIKEYKSINTPTHSVHTVSISIPVKNIKKYANKFYHTSVSDMKNTEFFKALEEYFKTDIKDQYDIPAEIQKEIISYAYSSNDIVLYFESDIYNKLYSKKTLIEYFSKILSSDIEKPHQLGNSNIYIMKSQGNKFSFFKSTPKLEKKMASDKINKIKYCYDKLNKKSISKIDKIISFDVIKKNEPYKKFRIVNLIDDEQTINKSVVDIIYDKTEEKKNVLRKTILTMGEGFLKQYTDKYINLKDISPTRPILLISNDDTLRKSLWISYQVPQCTCCIPNKDFEIGITLIYCQYNNRA